jgi:hypothetical protein
MTRSRSGDGPHELNLAADIPEQAQQGSQGCLVYEDAGQYRSICLGPYQEVAEPLAQFVIGAARQLAADLEFVGQLHCVALFCTI